ncbi:transglutaminase-like domain-containing protein [Cohnella herbarum]|uniref:Transglutaminase domain-containing protein n=1 Tax=Cohnella herbarum TaxID=2728023 RepID=A0A7Z2VG08_9BACL|nr:transglutaminase-like domain-containing protein [Cohnella herbarum]QJD82347.1 transglutaminase domain-containing protein [Cohnella herbarum]
MLRTTRLLLAALVLFVTIPAVAFANSGENAVTLDTSEVDKGMVGIRLASKTNVVTKAKVSKGSSNYIYTLNTSKDGQTVWLPLQMGDGEYEVAVLENVAGKSYRVNLAEKIRLAVTNAPDVFLNSVQNIDWLTADKASDKAKELTKGAATDEEKAKAIYDYIVKNVSYDKALARTVTSDYVPDIDGTLTSGKAICYGYATLYASMLRSVGIPAKLAMGTTKWVDEYHAWNEVYLNGKWVVVDTTVDAGLSKGTKKVTFDKKANDYTPVKFY